MDHQLEFYAEAMRAHLAKGVLVPRDPAEFGTPDVSLDQAYGAWMVQRGVWPRVFNEELFAAGWRAARATRRLLLVKSTCEVRDDRWSIHIDAGDEPCSVHVRHRQYGSYYDWPETTFEGRDGSHGGICLAADRAYVMEEESNFHTRSVAMKAAHDFLRRFGAGEIEYLEWDVDSQSMVVVGHSPRAQMWLRHPEDKPDPLAPFFGDNGESLSQGPQILNNTLTIGPVMVVPLIELKPGDEVVIDREKGHIRLATPNDAGQRYVLPEQFFVNVDGFLEIPR